MKKFLFVFLLAAAVAGVFSVILAQDEEATGEKKFVIHGEIRQRADYMDNMTDANSDVSDSFLYYPYRVRIGAEGHFAKDVVGYAEFQTFGFWGDTSPIRGGAGTGALGTFDQNFQNDGSNATPSGTWANNVDLYEGWIALNHMGGSKFSLKFGRQEIVKGSEMLLGDADYYSGISHDGAVMNWQNDSLNLDVWVTRPLQHTNVTVVTDPLEIPTHQSVNFYGGWLDFTKIPRNIRVAAYVMYMEQSRTTADPEGFHLYTIGGRANRDATPGKSGFAWSAEYAMQTGQETIDVPPVTDFDIGASAYELMLGYQIHTGRADHMFHVSYAFGSGDKASSTKDEAFDPLFQDNHMRYGLADLYFLTDLVAISAGWNMHSHNHEFGADYWIHQLDQDVTVAPGQNEKDLDTEIDGWWKYQFTSNCQVMSGLAYVMPGDYTKAIAGNHDDAAMRLVGNLRLRF